MVARFLPWISSSILLHVPVQLGSIDSLVGVFGRVHHEGSRPGFMLGCYPENPSCMLFVGPDKQGSIDSLLGEFGPAHKEISRLGWMLGSFLKTRRACCFMFLSSWAQLTF